MRLAVLSLVAAPYWEPLYRRLHQSQELELQVFLLQGSDSLRGWSAAAPRYPTAQLPCLTPEWLYPLPVFGVLNRGLRNRLRAFQPDCLLLHGYSYWPHLQAVRWAVKNGIPYLLWADSNARTGRGWVPPLKEIWMRYFARHAAGVLVIGSSSREFWRRYQVGPERQFWSPLAVDNEFFAREASRWRACRASLREQLGLPPGRLLLYAGRLAAPKNLSRLLHAMDRHRRSVERPLLLALVGDGPERRSLEKLIRDLRLDNVRCFGFQTQADLPKFYALADALVLPSRYEPWGLVVNEAMAAGLPVLVARSAGCAADLLEEGVNGFSFDETDVNAMAACFDHYSRLSEEDLAQLGARSAARVAGWTLDHSLAGFCLALEKATGWRPQPLASAPSLAAAPLPHAPHTRP